MEVGVEKLAKRCSCETGANLKHKIFYSRMYATAFYNEGFGPPVYDLHIQSCENYFHSENTSLSCSLIIINLKFSNY